MHRASLKAPALILACLLQACTGGGEGTDQDPLRDRYALFRPSSAIREAGECERLCNVAATQVQKGAYPQALETYMRALEADEGSVRARYNLARTYMDLGRFPHAVEQLKRVVELAPEFADAHFALGVAYAQHAPAMETGSVSKVRYEDLDRGIEACRRAVALEPDNPRFHYNLGRVLQLRRKYAEAAAEYEHVLELDPEMADAYWRLGVITAQEEAQLEEAAQALRAAVHLDSTSAKMQADLGDVLERCGDLEAAASAYERAVEISPDRETFWLALGKLYHRMGRAEDSQRAMAHYEQLDKAGGDALHAAKLAVQRSPDSPEAHRMLAAAVMEEGDLPRAARELQIALTLNSEDPETNSELGFVLARMDRIPAAIEALERAVALAPDSSRYHLRLGQANAAAQRLDAAEASFKRAAALSPARLQPKLDLAKVYLNTDRYSMAERVLKGILDEKPDHVEARYNLALVCLATRRGEAAAAHLERVLHLAPEHREARHVLTRLRQSIAARSGAGERER